MYLDRMESRYDATALRGRVVDLKANIKTYEGAIATEQVLMGMASPGLLNRIRVTVQEYHDQIRSDQLKIERFIAVANELDRRIAVGVS